MHRAQRNAKLPCGLFYMELLNIKVLDGVSMPLIQKGDIVFQSVLRLFQLNQMGGNLISGLPVNMVSLLLIVKGNI